MVFPSTTLVVPLPEEIGIIKNVNAIIQLSGKTITIPCEHITRYCALSECTWPELFDESSTPFPINRKIYNNGLPNTSVFQGIYTFYDETYLEGELHFVFDFCKDDFWHKNYHTKTMHFKEDKSNYYEILELLN